MFCSVIFTLLLCVPFGGCLQRIKGNIPELDIEAGSVSVSGISAGAAMATQMHVAHSADIKGVGLFAGSGPYHCAAGTLSLALGRCMVNPANIPVEALVQDTAEFAASNDIDDPTNMKGSNVFIWHGGFDETVHPGASVATREYYENYEVNIKFACINRWGAGHCQPIADNSGTVGNADCGVTASPYINVCDYDGAFNALDHIYNNTLQAPSRPVEATGDLIEFQQNDYILNPGGVSLGDTGFIYVPQACNTQTCKLHIAFHGCIMDYVTIGTDYVEHGGYNEVADANNIVILYPQAKRSLTIPYNPNGCFDWWGYNGGDLTSHYATKTAPQIETVWSMVADTMTKKK